MSLDNIEKALELGLKLDTLSYQQSQAEYQECDRRSAKLDSEIKVIRSQIKQALADLKAYRERLESGQTLIAANIRRKHNTFTDNGFMCFENKETAKIRDEADIYAEIAINIIKGG